MVFAHFPAGYLMSQSISQRVSLPREAHFALWLGSIAPDFDLVFTVFFHTISHRLYPTHIPFFYALLTISFLIFFQIKKSQWLLLSLYFLIGCWLHLLLDSPTGLLLLYPLNTQRIQLIETQHTFIEYFQTPLFLLEFLILIPFFVLILKKTLTKFSG
jgi:hypothetical protein